MMTGKKVLLYWLKGELLHFFVILKKRIRSLELPHKVILMCTHKIYLREKFDKVILHKIENVIFTT